jgi:hypothetical protein
MPTRPDLAAILLDAEHAGDCSGWPPKRFAQL